MKQRSYCINGGTGEARGGVSVTSNCANIWNNFPCLLLKSISMYMRTVMIFRFPEHHNEEPCALIGQARICEGQSLARGPVYSTKQHLTYIQSFFKDNRKLRDYQWPVWNCLGPFFGHISDR